VFTAVAVTQGTPLMAHLQPKSHQAVNGPAEVEHEAAAGVGDVKSPQLS
jgi:hypothetical protein